MKYLNTLIKGILAGLSISIGGWLCLRTNALTTNSVLGAFLFSIGLILICNFGFFLYTGKICYLFTDKTNSYKSKISDLALGLIGNLLGCLFVGITLHLTIKDLNNNVFNNLETMVANKLNYEWYQMIVLSFFCGILVYIAVEGFKKIDNIFGKYVVLFLAIGGFIVCGFEHSIANMFYFFVSGSYSLEVFVSIFLCILGNSLGGLLIPSLLMLIKLNNDKE